MSALSLETETEKAAPEWLRGCGWVCLIALAVLPVLPGQAAALNFAGALGLAALLALRLTERRPLWPDARLAAVFVLFAASVVLAMLVPAVRDGFGSKAFGLSLRAAWDTAKAATAAGLALALLRDRRSLATFLALWTLGALLVAFWAPLDHVLFGNRLLRDRLEGARGNPSRYSATLYYQAFGVAMLLTYPAFWRETFSRRAIGAGFVLAAALVAGVFAKKHTGLAVPLLAPKAAAEIAALGAAAAGVAAWSALFRPGRARALLAGAALLLLFSNIVLTGTRLNLLLAAAAVGAWGLSTAAGRRLRLPLAAAALLGAGLFAYCNPRGLDSSSLRGRFYIWSEAWEMTRGRLAFGSGYGADTFAREWRLRPHTLERVGNAEEEDILLLRQETDHAHNLWLELLVERGVAGLLAFHALWLGVLAWLARAGRGPALPAALLLGLLALEGVLAYSARDRNEILFWLVAALGLAATRLRGETENADSGDARSRIFSLTKTG